MDNLRLADTEKSSPEISVDGTSACRLESLSSAQLIASLVPAILSAALLAVIAWPMLTEWYWEYTKPESYYAHAPLVPLMSAFMLWSRREQLRQIEYRPYLPGFALLLPSIALLVFAEKSRMPAVANASFLLTIWSSILLVFGKSFFKSAWFPLLFLVLMAPLPGPILNDSTLRLQMWSTMLASKILGLTGFGNTVYGNIIHIDNYTMDVDVPCSGFKTLLAMMTFNAFLAFMLDGPLYRRVLLFIICAPLALLINGVRIALIGMVGECIGTNEAHVFHDYSGIITLILGFLLLFTIARSFGCRKFAGWDIF